MKIMVAGCAGRMGIAVIQTVINNPDLQLVSGLVAAEDEANGKDLGLLAGCEQVGICASTDIEQAVAVADAVIDFTIPDLTMKLAQIAVDKQKILVTGTTGLSEEQQIELARLANNTVIVQSFNMSMGVNLLAGLVQKLAAVLDEEFDIEICETHHRYKVDAPSGTALLLGEAAALGRMVDLESAAVQSRLGRTGPRKKGDIGFAVLRGGAVVGEHSVKFMGDDEHIELKHIAFNRKIYAKGALKAAMWAQSKTPAGLYGMNDVLQL